MRNLLLVAVFTLLLGGCVGSSVPLSYTATIDAATNDPLNSIKVALIESDWQIAEFNQAGGLIQTAPRDYMHNVTEPAAAVLYIALIDKASAKISIQARQRGEGVIYGKNFSGQSFPVLFEKDRDYLLNDLKAALLKRGTTVQYQATKQ